MRRLAILLIALAFIGAAQGFTQEATDPLPPRFRPAAKNDRFRLVRVLGNPEIPPTFDPKASFSGDGKYAIYAEDLSHPADVKDDKKDKVSLRYRTRLLLFDLQTRSWPQEIDLTGRSVNALQLNADGNRVLLAGDRNVGKDNASLPYLSLLDLHSGKEIYSILAADASKQALCVALSPDETSALTGFEEGVQHWDLKQGKALDSYATGQKQPGSTVAFLPGGKQFLAGFRGGEVRLWDVGKKKPSRTYFNKADANAFIWHLALSRDGKRFASGDSQPSITLWDTETGKPINTYQREKSPIESIATAIALADDGKTILSSWTRATFDFDDYHASRLQAWDAETKKVLWSHPTPYRGRVPLLSLGDKLLAGGGSNLFETWSVKDGKRLDSWGGHKGSVNAVVTLANGDLLSAGQEGMLMTWRAGQLVNKRAAHTGSISVLALSPDRKQALTAGADQVVKLWDADGEKPLQVLKGHTASVTSVAFSKSGKWACSGSSDRSVKTWDLTTGKEIATLTGHADSVNAIALSPDENWLASASDDATIRVWPIKDGKLDPDREASLLEGHKKAVVCVAFSPDGKSLLSGSQDQTLKVWDWAKEKVTRTITGHKNWVTSILFLDANTVLSTSDDLSICRWELDSGKEIGRIDFGPLGDCPRCVTRLGSDRLLVGTSSWLIYEFQILPAGKSKAGVGSSN